MFITNVWMKQMWYIYIYKGIVLSHKKNEIMPSAATWMQLEIIILREVRKRTNPI